MEIVIVGVVVSFLVQWLKTKFGETNEWKSLAVLAGVSLVAAFGYTYLVSAGYWESVANVLMVASTFYVIVLARFKA